jgi:protein SFI1
MDDLISAAEKAYSNHIARVYRACFLIWRVAALRSHPLHQRLDQEASKYDRRKLLYEAFSCWRNLLHYRRQQMEVRRFFARLERRAVKARNLYLLTKAFTHWAALAREAAQRTALARQHILRLKYFSAWRELAARNELIVREFALRRYLARWRLRFALRCRQAADAVLLDEYKLLQRAYARLFWGFCERRAPAWFRGISKRKHFTRWADRLQQRRDACCWAEARYRARLLGRFLHAWRARARFVAEREAAVARSDRAIVARTVLVTWLEQTRLCPVYRRASAMVCYRLARNTFNLWRTRTRAERFGAAVDRLRVLRNAWTAWNDRLRWQSLRMRIDDRIVLEALYKWVLAERLALCRQLFDHQLKRRALIVIWQRRRELKLRLGQGVPAVEAHRNRHALMLALSLWRQRLERYGEDIRIAYRFWAPRTELDILQQWGRRLMQVRQMRSDAANAAYFFVATKSIRRWRDAVAQSKRIKRQAAYAAVRRKHKMALAKHVLYSWRDRVAYLAQMENAALGTYQARLTIIVSSVVAEWRRRVWHATEASAEATAVRNSALLRTTMLPWVLWARQAQEQSGQAAYQAELLVLKRTAALLRKLSLLAFQHRSRERNAEELRSRNDRQHVRRMFWYWRNKAAAARIGDAPQSPRQGPSVEVAGNVAVTPDRRPVDVRDEEGFNDLSMAASAVPPRASAVPGYLATPINRISRANALLRMSTTPGTPQTNSFQTRLQSQLFTDRRPAAARRPDFSASMPAPKR